MKVSITNSYSNPINVSVGVHQGAVVSPPLFASFYMEQWPSGQGAN